MAQIVSREVPGNVVTVAELMRRCAPAPESADDGGDPIPVAALLRREGHSAAGLPVVQAPAVGELLSALPARHPILRRGRIAAGALLAAGSVVGLASAMNAVVTPPTSSGVYPDQGEPAVGPHSSALDAGDAAPTSWLPVAFPTGFAETAPSGQAAPQAAPHRAAPPQAVARRVVAPAAAEPTGAAGAATSAASAAGPTGASDGGGVVAKTTKDVGDTVRDVGADTPLEGVTDTVGDTVSGLGHGVDSLAAPITAPVTSLLTRSAAPVTAPVTTLLTKSAAPVTAPVTTLLTKSAASVTAPVTTLLTKSAAPVTAPVTSLLARSAAPATGSDASEKATPTSAPAEAPTVDGAAIVRSATRLLGA